jgi:predicted RNA-binding protein with RPS1 domain
MSCTGRRSTALFADLAEEVEAPSEEITTEETTAEIPAEVEAMDGVESVEEAHNVDRPARAQLKKKSKNEGTELSDLVVGSMVKGSVKSITNYGAFIDIGAQTDGLLHISQLASGFVANVGDVLSEGEEVEVRIIAVDAAKSQVALSLMTEEQSSAQQGGGRQRQQSNRRDDTAALANLVEKKWDAATFVEGTVVSTVDFGCFVRVDIGLLNSECEGAIDGLVHISALSNSRVSSVTDMVNVDDKVQVRVKSITGNKVSLTMLSVADEDKKQDAYNERGGGGGGFQGAKDWKESCEKMEADMPEFKNMPMVEDRRK